MLNVLNVRENEGLFRIEAKRDDVFDVFLAHRNRACLAVEFTLGPIDVLLVVGDLNHKRHVERILKVLREQEWNTVTHVQRASRGPTTSVEVEGLLLLVGVEDFLQVSLAEEDTTSDKAMGLHARERLDPFDQLVCQVEATVLLDQFFVIDAFVTGSLNVECADLVLGRFLLLLSGSFVLFG